MLTLCWNGESRRGTYLHFPHLCHHEGYWASPADLNIVCLTSGSVSVEWNKIELLNTETVKQTRPQLPQSYLRHLRANPCCFSTQLLLLLLHLRVRFGPQVIRDDLVAEHWDSLLGEFLSGKDRRGWKVTSERRVRRKEPKVLTAKSSSRSGESSSGMMTWWRNEGVFSFLSSLLIVFSWPDSRAKLSKTEGLLENNHTLRHQ